MCLYDTLSASIKTAMLASVIDEDRLEFETVECFRDLGLGGLFGGVR